MTTQALFDRKMLRGCWNTAYFLGELRRSWANCLLYFLVYFFSLVVPMLNDLSNYRSSDFYDSFTTGPVRDLDYYIPAIFVLFAMLIAVWAGVSACGYLHKRISVYHFHSMPIRREGMLLVKSAVALADFALALILNLAQAMFIAGLMGENVGVILILGLYCLFGFVLAYSFTVLCGIVCGTRSFHVIFTGIAAFVGPAFLYAIYLIAQSVCRFLQPDYLVEEGTTLYRSSPFVYVIGKLDMQGYLSPWAILLLCLLAIGFFVGALALIRIRPTEGAESSMIFRPVGIVLKYVVMALITVYLGYFFGEIFNSDDFWLLFGMISGALLSFMLMNVLIHRNARKMFSGLVGLAAFAVLFTGAYWGVSGWFSYKDDHGFKANMIKTVAIGDHERRQLVFTSPEIIEQVAAFTDGYFAEVNEAMRENINNSSPIVEVYSIEKYPVDTEVTIAEAIKVAALDARSIYITQTSKLGATRTWRLYFDQFSELDDITTTLCRTIADSDEFAEQYISMLLTPGGELYSAIRNREEGEKWSDLHQTDFVAMSPTYAAIEAELRSQIGFEFFQQRQIASVGIVVEDPGNGNARVWFDFPIYASQPKLLAVASDEADPKALIEKQIQGIEPILVGIRRDPATGELLDSIVLDDAMALAVCRNENSVISGRSCFFLTRLSREYVFANGNYGANVNFIDGKVPDYVVKLFEDAKK